MERASMSAMSYSTACEAVRVSSSLLVERPGISMRSSTMASAMRGSRPRASATERNSPRKAEVNFSSTGAMPVGVTWIGSAAPMAEPGSMASCSVAMAIKAPAEKALRTTAMVGSSVRLRMSSTMRCMAGTAPPGVSITNSKANGASRLARSMRARTNWAVALLISPSMGINQTVLAGAWAAARGGNTATSTVIATRPRANQRSGWVTCRTRFTRRF